MTYQDIYNHCIRKMKQLEGYKDSKGSKLYGKYNEHRMIANVLIHYGLAKEGDTE